MLVQNRVRRSHCAGHVGDVFTIPANLEKSFDQIARGVAHVFSSGALPVMLGGDHSIGFPCVRGIGQCIDKRIGIIHFDRHIDIQGKNLDERMHAPPWYWATNLPNVPATNLVQLGIGGWQVPREGVEVARKRNTNVLTIADIEKLGLERTAEIAIELAWKDADAVYISLDVVSIDCGFVPGTGWPEPGGFQPREALKILGLVAAEGLCGFEVVEVSPPYDTSDITALVGVRVVVEALGSMVAHGKLGRTNRSSTSRLHIEGCHASASSSRPPSRTAACGDRPQSCPIAANRRAMADTAPVTRGTKSSCGRTRSR